MASFVLVHGAFHGAWCYAQVAAKLRAHGHDVFVPTLSGVGELAHLSNQTINLTTHVSDISAIIEMNDLRDVILCGHSYAGMVITGVAGRLGERIRTLFYLDACLPEDGQSAFDIAGPEFAAPFLALAGNDGTMMEAPPAEAFQVGPDDIARVRSLLTPHPIATFIEKIRYTGKEAIVPNRTYVLCERYPSVNHSAYAKAINRPSWRTAALDCGHDLMIDEPKKLASLLLEELLR